MTIRNNSIVTRIAVAAVAVIAFTRDTHADPCGMVPPLHIQGPVPLERIGLQKTYVFFRDGVETFVIRPGFQGKVEEFGMLIPFPTPPALRKVPDDCFAHIAAAVDPPEVVVDLTPVLWEVDSALGAEVDFSEVAEESPQADKALIVLKQEAVGMYEVAVLQAGSADALSKWMTDHGYRYPDGMDEVCNDYVKDGWCFVAVKARVGQKNGVDPKPGMKTADASLPEGALFDGHVQGMGFRFLSDELVVPMRLSAFNEGDLHNVVYLLTDKPMKARDLPAGHVVRQLTGAELLHNVTQPLPLRIIGGKFEDIPEYRLASLKTERDPSIHNGIAKVLFAGDLEAARTKQLAHHHEELEKVLLDIGERLNLRGPEIDALHDKTLDAEREEIAAAAIKQLESMSLTVIDGDFEREVVAAQNVYFTSFEMNPSRNTPRRSNARTFGPSEEGPGILSDFATTSAGATVAVTHPTQGRLLLQQSESGTDRRVWLILCGVVVTTVFVFVMFMRRKRGAAGLLILLAINTGGMAQDAQSNSQPSVEILLSELQEGADRDAALSRARSLAETAVAELLSIAKSPGQIERRGWAVLCLNEMNTADSLSAMESLANDKDMHALVKTWAASALIGRANNLKALETPSRLCSQLPALRRPLALQIVRLMQKDKSGFTAESMLRMMAENYEMQQTLAPLMLKVKPAELIQVQLTSEAQKLRQQAAAWLATLKHHNVDGVEDAVITSLTFNRDANEVPWKSGPLYVPALNWNKEKAVQLINELTAWYVWCSANQQTAEMSKIHTNLNSIQLMNAAGFHEVPNNVTEWLKVWQEVIGKDQLDMLIKRSGYSFTPAKTEKLE